jgi:hypothetical protein
MRVNPSDHRSRGISSFPLDFKRALTITLDSSKRMERLPMLRKSDYQERARNDD